MTERDVPELPPMAVRHHIALHLGHRWFAYLEAPGGDLQMHLSIFSPQVFLQAVLTVGLNARDRDVAALQADEAAVLQQLGLQAQAITGLHSSLMILRWRPAY